MSHPDEVLAFWFPPGYDADEPALRHRIEWWFRGGADAEIVSRFTTLLEEAARGEHDAWAATPRGRLALIIVLDQFSRSVYRNRPETYAQDDKAVALAVESLDNGHWSKLGSIWEKTFGILPFAHSEKLELHDRSVPLVEGLVAEAAPHERALAEFSVKQAQGHRDVVRRFGRHPHRNAVLGRPSTPEELEFLAAGDLVHKREPPPAGLGIGVVLASVREGRRGEGFARWIHGKLAARDGVRAQLIDLRDWPLPPWTSSTLPGAAEKTYEEGTLSRRWADTIRGLDGFVVVTPEYNHGYPGQLKNALDHLYAPWNYKPVAFVSYGGPSGGARDVEQLFNVAVELRMIPLRDVVALSLVGLALDEHGGPKSEFFVKRAAAMVDELVFWGNAAREVRARKATGTGR
jgi:uncharacterized protein (DUF924 family)/NAD(P)H-dependent FMN reductase